MNVNKKIVSLVTKLTTQRKKAPRSCIVEGCNEMAINSHILQKNGILNLICEDRHFFVFEQKNFFTINMPFELPIHFRKIGINKGLSYPLFCNKHDTNFFSSIEQEDYNPQDYTSQLLFSYRSCSMELRKKEIQIDIQGGMLNSPLFRIEANDNKIDHVSRLLHGYVLGKKDLDYFMKEFEYDLEHNMSRKFEFVTIETDSLDICTSAIFSPVDYGLTDAEQLELLDSVFISVFPKNGMTIIICGFHKDHCSKWIKEYVYSWKGLCGEDIQKRVSTVLIKRCETWGMSPKLYNSISEGKRERILHEFMNDVMNLDQGMETEINIFAN